MQVVFTSPTIGIPAITVQAGTCAPFVCGLVPCTAASVVINRDIAAPPQSGIVEVLVTMTQDITVIGTPTLQLDVQPAPVTASFSYGTVQYIEVDASSVAPADLPLTTGYFTVSYGGTESQCIHITSAESLGGGQSMQSRLLEIPAAAMIGVLSVTRQVEAVSGTVLFAVTFGAGIPLKLAVPAVPLVTCPVALPTGAVVGVPRTNTISFMYTLQTPVTASPLKVVPNSLALAGGTINRVSSTSTQAANLVFTAATLSGSRLILSGIDIDCSVAPVVTAIQCTSPGSTYGAGQRIYWTVQFDAPVTVTGKPLLYLNSGVRTAAVYYAGSGTSLLSFRYTVKSTDSVTPNLAHYSIEALSATGGTIISTLASQFVYADLELPVPAPPYGSDGTAIIIDTTPPAVTAVAMTKLSAVDASPYGAGEQIRLSVTYSSQVDVSSTPYIALNNGGRAVYSPGQTQVMHRNIPV
jgi:hypothetical protein